jgi:transposase-like protein
LGKPRQFERLRAADIAAAVASSRSLAEAARTLGVHKSTLVRWRRAGKAPDGRGPRERPAADVPETPPVSGAVAGAFETWARARYVLSRTEHELVRLADAALVLAHSPTETTAGRLAAMREFRNLVTALNLPKLDTEDENDGDTPATIHPFPRPV